MWVETGVERCRRACGADFLLSVVLFCCDRTLVGTPAESFLFPFCFFLFSFFPFFLFSFFPFFLLTPQRSTARASTVVRGIRGTRSSARFHPSSRTRTRSPCPRTVRAGPLLLFLLTLCSGAPFRVFQDLSVTPWLSRSLTTPTSYGTERPGGDDRAGRRCYWDGLAYIRVCCSVGCVHPSTDWAQGHTLAQHQDWRHAEQHWSQDSLTKAL